MTKVVISGTGVFTPPYSVSNAELVETFNTYVDKYNKTHAAEIERGEVEPLNQSSVEFIVKASGIESRYVMDKSGIVDPEIMAPRLRQRSNDEPSILAEMSVDAAQKALKRANKTAADIDAVLVACSNLERPYPAIAVEVQELLGIEGFGFDMNVACSSATFAIQTAYDMLRSGSVDCVLIVDPEICSGHLNFRDRDSHFIFGDVATAIVVEREETCTAKGAWEILGTRLLTKFSNNIRNNFGFLNRATPEGIGAKDKLFVQEGRKVFKEVVPMVSQLILEHMADEGLDPKDLKRMWLHQANKSMNDFIGRKVLGRDPEPGEQPNILHEYANTSSAGSIIAFSKFNEDLKEGDLGLICSFGAGYSAGNVLVRKRA
ncbi:beta-ketoacyl-ACP synthase III [Parvibaculum sp.]|uniref:beta-ketoacyl-ACP synthase III n=1 Tax=Parvibaculum sp. TaxID=2024848 RepID=UPI002730AC5D|nr:beta-ketoacyl-ACP synthase III [Parvibaculum sp.]MDP1626804.1 beta-ketoacyl-ACP synthase III [Parvibaculum sp.]MDP2148450.1 beta-ketoacyl-ACP synthase III [Parvibaculum sp.]MDP3329733.1 beta-ketoacyl-ACP synthase III [Parvibaculum sp.]